MKRSICGLTTMLVKHGRLCLVTSPSTIQSDLIQVLTRRRRSVFTMTICRRQRQHETAPPLPGPHPVGLTPSLREAPATAQNEPNRQRIHLAEPKRCLDEAGHLSSSEGRSPGENEEPQSDVVHHVLPHAIVPVPC